MRAEIDVKSSIRKFLLVNVLLAIISITTLTALGNYLLGKRDIQEHLDSLITVTALSYQALIGDDLKTRPLEKIQQNLNNIPNKIDLYYKKGILNKLPPQSYFDKFNFQLWTDNGKLLLRSAGSPDTPFTPSLGGFSNNIIDKKIWRVFTNHNHKTKTHIILAEEHNTRNQLGYRIAQDDLYIMLLTFPLTGLLIWIIIGRGLDSLDRVAKEVANRAPTHLEPVNLKEIPEEIKPVIDELNNLFNRLKEGFEREKRFAADAAHELRTPLAALKAQAQVALNISDLDIKNKALQKLITSVNRTTHVVQQLLIMSQLAPETAIISETDELNLVRSTREVLAMMAPSAVEKHISLEFEYDESNPSFAGNITTLSILTRNLVDNAIRYCKEYGKVAVRIYAQNKNIILEVQDNGPGIPKELHTRVFERFYRVLGNQSQGSGLGLAIVKQITDLHNAEVKLISPVEEQGLIVRVYLPIIHY